MEAQNKHGKFEIFTKTRRIINILGLEELFPSSINLHQLFKIDMAIRKFENNKKFYNRISRSCLNKHDSKSLFRVE